MNAQRSHLIRYTCLIFLFNLIAFRETEDKLWAVSLPIQRDASTYTHTKRMDACLSISIWCWVRLRQQNNKNDNSSRTLRLAAVHGCRNQLVSRSDEIDWICYVCAVCSVDTLLNCAWPFECGIFCCCSFQRLTDNLQNLIVNPLSILKPLMCIFPLLPSTAASNRHRSRCHIVVQLVAIFSIMSPYTSHTAV